MYPASGSSPLARCEQKPASVNMRSRGKLRMHPSMDTKANPPKSCTQQSVTLPPDVHIKYRQELAYQGETWQAMYSTLRNGIEGMNGFLKDGSFEALDDPERRRLRGIAGQTVLVAFLVFAANLRKIRSFLDKRAATVTRKVKSRPRRRRTDPIGKWRPHAPSVDPRSQSPPAGAAG